MGIQVFPHLDFLFAYRLTFQVFLDLHLGLIILMILISYLKLFHLSSTQKKKLLYWFDEVYNKQIRISSPFDTHHQTFHHYKNNIHGPFLNTKALDLMNSKDLLIPHKVD